MLTCRNESIISFSGYEILSMIYEMNICNYSLIKGLFILNFKKLLTVFSIRLKPNNIKKKYSDENIGMFKF